MYLVRTEIRPSEIHGVGVFALEPIAKGQTVWRYDLFFDIRVTDFQFACAPKIMQEHIQKRGYRDEGGFWIMDGGHNQFVNHSEDPNCVVSPDWESTGVESMVAARDIAVGEELTECYHEYDQLVSVKDIPEFEKTRT
jgi:SET domain-containing protein